jgi:cellulose biosynthesis protein BcsQ
MFIAWLYHDAEFNECLAGHLHQLDLGNLKFTFMHNPTELQGTNFDFIFSGSEFMESIPTAHDTEKLIELFEKNSSVVSKHKIKLFQNKSALVNDILEIVNHENNPIPLPVENSCQIHVVYSGAGGVGKTTFALEFSKLLSSGLENVLYISFEYCKCSHEYQAYSFSTLLLDSLRMEAFLDKDILNKIHKSNTGFYILNHFRRLNSLEDMLPSEMQRIFTLLKTKFRQIVIDLPNEFTSITNWILQNADHIVLIEGRTEQAFQKNRTLLSELNSSNLLNNDVKIRLFTSKYYELNKTTALSHYFTSTKFTEEVKNWNQQAIPI